MTGIEEVAAGTFCLKQRIPGEPAVFSIYLIRETAGAIIEPGPAALIPAIQAAVRKLGLKEIVYIIPTHIHMDHAGGVGGLAGLFPEAKVVVHPLGAKHIVDPSRLIRSTQMAFGKDFAATFGAILPVTQSQVKVAQDGERLLIDGRELVVVHTVGHAPHHIAVFDNETQGLFCGEALGLIYGDGIEPLPAVAPPGFDLEEYLNTMERLRRLEPRVLFYSHDGIRTEPGEAITAVARNTKLVGEAILGALKAGETEASVIRSTGEYIQERFGFRLGDYDLESNVKGYIHYFKKKGLA